GSTLIAFWRHMQVSNLAAAEFCTTLDALGVSQRRAAKLFNVTPRHVRRWQHGDRRVPHAVGIVCNILTTGMLTIEQIEAVAPVLPGTNGGADRVPPAEPASDQSASARAEVAAFADLSPAAAAIAALDVKCCHFPIGDPQHVGFRFCSCPATVGSPYCKRHRKQAYLPPRTAGARVGFVAHWRHGPTGAARAPKILLDGGGALPGAAPPPA